MKPDVFTVVLVVAVVVGGASLCDRSLAARSDRCGGQRPFKSNLVLRDNSLCAKLADAVLCSEHVRGSVRLLRMPNACPNVRYGIYRIFGVPHFAALVENCFPKQANPAGAMPADGVMVGFDGLLLGYPGADFGAGLGVRAVRREMSLLVRGVMTDPALGS